MSSNQISGRSAFIELLKAEGITQMFGNPGTTELPIMHALATAPEMGYVLGLQEAVVIAMADGYARASGKLVVVQRPCRARARQRDRRDLHLADVGHGDDRDGRPAGAGPRPHRAAALRAAGADRPPVVKWAVEVSRIEDLPRILRRAAKVATTAPTGPVFISLPGDILNSEAAIDLGRAHAGRHGVRPSDAALEQLARRLLVGQEAGDAGRPRDRDIGCLRRGGASSRRRWACRCVQQTVGHGAHFPSEHPCYLGALNRDQKRVRGILAEYDLMLCVGADVLQMSVWSEVEPLPRPPRWR